MRIITKSVIVSCILLLGFSSCTIQKRVYLEGYHITWLNKSHLNLKRQKILVKDSLGDKNKSEALANFSAQDLIAALPPGISGESKNYESVHIKMINQKSSFSKTYFKGHDTKRRDKLNMRKTGNKEQQIDKDSKRVSKRKIAIIIGACLLLMALIAGLTVPGFSELFVLGNPALTALNVTADFGKYMRFVAGWIGILMLDLLVSLGVYRYYKDDKPSKARLTGILRFIYSVILGVGIFKLLTLSSSSSVSVIYNSINMFNKIWGLGLIVFGLHLIALGITFENEGGKKWVNIAIKSLLILAGIGYIIQYVGILFVANPIAFAAAIQPIFIIPMILGEVFYAIWKLVKGGKKPGE